MTGFLIIVPGVCYLAAAGLYAYQRHWPMAIVYFGYALGNVGLFLVDRTLMAK